jgi:hypothetical protein
MGNNKVFAWILVFLAAAALLFALAFRKMGGDTREQIAKVVDRLQAEVKSRAMPRSVLTGKASPGNGWDAYSIALNDTPRWRNDQNGDLFLRFAKGDTHLDRAQVEQLMSLHAAALDHVRLGAHRSDGKYPYQWEQGPRMSLPSLLGSRRLAALAAAQAKTSLERGDSQDAVDLLLDTSVFGRDVAADAPMLMQMTGITVYSTVFDELRNVVLSGKLTKSQLGELGWKLETMDHDFPAWSSAIFIETLGLGVAMLHLSEQGPVESLALTRQWGFRFTLSPGPAMLEVLEKREAYLHRVEKLDPMSFADAKKEIDVIAADAAASPDTLMLHMTKLDLLRSVMTYRKALTDLRLLRAATAFLATGEMPALADPFGDKLLYKQEGNKSKIWSIGSGGGPLILEIPGKK